MGEDAIPKISVEPKALVGLDETVEAAALDNRNFIRVIVGGEPYLALLDPGATISLVGPRIFNNYRDQLQESTDQVKGVSSAPTIVQGTLKILIEINGQPGSLRFRAVEEIKHDMISGMDFGVKWNLVIDSRARLWKSGMEGEWQSFANSKEDSTMAIMAECAGLSEISASETNRIKAIVERLIDKPNTDYLPTTHLTEHHIELTDYTPIRPHPR